MVTKQQQLELIAKECHAWKGHDFILASDTWLGCRIPVTAGWHLITREEWQQERYKMQKRDGKVMSENEFEDELEKMYWDFDAERAKKSKCERLNFKMFMRIASGLRVERKQDNSWHERGELPPPETYCQFKKANEERGWVNCFVIGIDDLGFCVCRVDMDYFASMSSSDFRTLRTEREKAIDEMADLIAKSVFGSAKCQAERLYDSGYRKEQSK